MNETTGKILNFQPVKPKPDDSPHYYIDAKIDGRVPVIKLVETLVPGGITISNSGGTVVIHMIGDTVKL